MDNKIILTSQEDIRDEYELASLLRHIADSIENGNGGSFQQGFYPHWTLNVEYQKEELIEN
jgi:hypothetical protein